MIPTWTQAFRSRKTSDASSERQVERSYRNATQTKDPVFGLEDFVLNVHRLSTALSDSKIFADQGIGMAEWAILKSLHNNPPTRMRQIERQTNLSRQRVSKLLSELERKGFVSVSTPQEGDKRGRTAVATDQAARSMAMVTEGLRSFNIAGSGAGYIRASKLSRLLLRSVRGQQKSSGDAATPEGRLASLELR